MDAPEMGKTRTPQGFPGFSDGGRYKTRTCDLPHVKRMRYQLRQSSDQRKSFYFILRCLSRENCAAAGCQGRSRRAGWLPRGRREAAMAEASTWDWRCSAASWAFFTSSISAARNLAAPGM